jgi:hypothetical protein
MDPNDPRRYESVKHQTPAERKVSAVKRSQRRYKMGLPSMTESGSLLGEELRDVESKFGVSAVARPAEGDASDDRFDALEKEEAKVGRGFIVPHSLNRMVVKF